MAIPFWFRFSFLLLVSALLLSRSMGLSATDGDYNIATKPLYSATTYPPLMMLVMSRDEQLFNKAYSDYTDLDGDGKLDVTYQDAFDYSGYFDPKLCYSESNGVFKAAAKADVHKCSSGRWSGNFLNWVTMSRLDILRFVLYGGQRQTDNAKTVLERAAIPTDLHAWVKIYSGADIGSFAPLSGTQSFCNATISGTPRMRVKAGNWSEWSAGAISQCTTGSGEKPGSVDHDYTVRIEVCDPNASSDLRESFCQKYSNGTVDRYKPVGLLQTYGESGRLRFGMIGGSFSKPRSGGVLRRNIGRFAGNGSSTVCAAGDEVNLSDGTFCNQSVGAEGIINTLTRLKIDDKWNGSNWTDCNNWGLLNRQGFSDAGNGNLNNPGTGGQECSAWGNPVSEMYAEALRYIAGETEPSTAFTGGTDLTGLPGSVAWNDPYRLPSTGGNSYCATCSILVMSSGLNSFDSDEIPPVPVVGAADAATDAVGTHEGITGNYMVGRVVDNQSVLAVGKSVNTHEDICTAKNTNGKLSLVRGICPDIPSMEGSYLMAGLAYKANITDMRENRHSDRPGGVKNTVTTYGVALAESLPKFDIQVGGKSISLSPLCQSNKSGTAKIDGGPRDKNWRTCFLGSVGVGNKVSSASHAYVYGREPKADGSAGSFSLVWEDSLWGNDHDNDVVSIMTYCVGSTCGDDTNPKNNASYTGKDICWRSDSAICTSTNYSPNVGANEVLVRIENLSAYAGNAMMTGFAVSGSNDDGVHRLALRPGNSDGTILSACPDPTQSSTNCNNDPPAAWDKPKVLKFTLGTSNAKLLESPLWYAAKYGGFKDANKNGQPDAGEWDSRQTGVPDNYFLARDPSKLKAELDRIFANAAAGNAVTGGAAGGARISANSMTIETTYDLKDGSNNDWTGNISGVAVNTNGSTGGTLWSAAAKIPAAGSRKVFMVRTPTVNNASTGAVTTAASAASFSATDLTGGDRASKLATVGMGTIPTWFGSSLTVDDFVNYIKGAATYERRNGGTLRNRGSVLGDIINSSPELVSPRDDFGYGYWSSFPSVTWKKDLGDSYKAYLANKSSRTPMAYVGANDGMLHAFTASADSSGGEESFAFIPASSRAHLADLASPDYDHRYFVDGSLVGADVSFTAGGDWHSVLIGSVGAGGKSVFALDVSTPGSFDGSKVLWELDGTAINNLGYVLGKPVVVPIKKADGSPRWVAIFGNGVNSASGAPVLFVVDIQTGEILRQLKPGGTGYAIKNGLMNIAPVALRNSDGLVDAVYGGDMQGNLWKFDLTAADPGSWTVAFGGEPLFKAKSADGTPQPITGGLEVSTGPGGGVSIFFGTGQYFAVGDNQVPSNPPVQSLYGIWDPDTATSGTVSGRDELVGQTISSGTTSSGYVTRNVSRNQVSYAAKRGWYVDLVVAGTADGERFVGTPRLQNGRVIFTTFEPAGGSDCSPNGGTNWLYALNLLNGAGSMSGITTSPAGDSVCTGECGAISLSKDGKSSPPVKDTGIFIPPQGSITCDPTDSEADCAGKKLAAEKCTFVLRAPGADPLYLPRPCGRQSWRQVR